MIGMTQFQWPYKVVVPDAYCGMDRLCAQGATEIWSVLLIIGVVLIGVFIGSRL